MLEVPRGIEHRERQVEELRAYVDRVARFSSKDTIPPEVRRWVGDDLGSSDVYWDRISTIVSNGVDAVYDLTVEGLHNFVADDIVAHNSIEQDSDLVMFVYRDEYYNEETDQQGLAEIILAKHRNGPTGTERLSFLKRYAKFADLAA